MDRWSHLIRYEDLYAMKKRQCRELRRRVTAVLSTTALRLDCLIASSRCYLKAMSVTMLCKHSRHAKHRLRQELLTPFMCGRTIRTWVHPTRTKLRRTSPIDRKPRSGGANEGGSRSFC